MTGNSKGSFERGSALAASQRERLARAHPKFGAHRIIEAAGISPTTFWKAIGGGPLYYSSWVAIEHALDQLERENA